MPCRRESIAVPPFPAGAAPNGSAVGAAPANRHRDIHLNGRPVSQASTRAACSTATGPDVTIPDASVSLQRRFRHPGALATTKDHPEPRHTKDGDAMGRGALPPTSPSSPRQGLRPTETRMSRHRALALPPAARLPAGVHGPTLEPLDLRLSRFFTGNRRPPTACRLLQLDVTRARPRPVQSPTRSQQAAPNRMAPP